jgi:hypothetical protein
MPWPEIDLNAGRIRRYELIVGTDGVCPMVQTGDQNRRREPMEKRQRRRRFGEWIWLGAIMMASLLVYSTPARAEEKEPTAEQTEFFEKKIRPVLVEKCYSCHSHQAKKVKGKYYLDSREGIRKGGESGDAAIVPGDPEKSALIKMIKRVDEDEAMPPKKKDALSEQQVKDFEKWIKDGAPDPRKEPDKSAPGKKADAGNSPAKEHWAFKKPVEPVVPQVQNAGWVRSPLDAFVLARLESRNMTPAPQADKRTLIRRAYFTLIGLPPSPEEVAAFEADASPEGFARVVNRLLLSPHYGERWGRFWLDVARYADTKGYVFEAERKFPYAYTYRDYVIRAFNEDLPYDQFLIQQIAADRLDLKGDNRPLAAMGFLTVGRRFLENQQDIIDDRIDVVTRGTMALTVQCARCHDHKYDPIPTQDYYSLYGIFSSSIEPQKLPPIGASEQTAASLAFDKQLQAKEAAAEAFLAEKSGDGLKVLRSAKVIADYLMAAEFATASPAETTELNKRLVARWAEFLAPSKSAHNSIWAPWQAYASIEAKDFANKAPGVTEQLFAKIDPAKPIHPVIAELFRGKSPATMREVADRYGQLLASNAQDAEFADSDKESLRLVLYGLYSPLYATGDMRVRFLKRDDRGKYMALKKEADALRANDPGAPPLAMVLNDSPTPGDVNVFKRGNPGMPGDVAPRRFLACVSIGERKLFRDGSGRLELARAIASPENPLTARVMVNRIWLNQFGAGLVRTPSDFGVRSDAPVYPEVLDWLALRFVENGWSIKKLQRTIMLSATWQQASDNPHAGEYAVNDPQNLLLWKQNRRRMDFETLRDTLIAVTGNLDETSGGRPVDIIDPANNRRSVYGFIDRQNLPGMFRTFDFASPDTHSPNRFFTTVPQQALFMMNSPLVERASRQLASREDVESESVPARRVEKLYRDLLGRSPTAEEVSDAVAFVQAEESQPASGPSPWRYGVGRYDSSSDRVVEFKAFPQFLEGRWRPEKREIEAGTRLKWVGLFAEGGHPGGDASSAVIRRWIAPADGVLAIGGTVSHKQASGDGVTARIVSSRAGQLANWAVAQSEAATNLAGVAVRQGDTIDFIVDCRTNQESDSFMWAPSLRLAGPKIAVAGGEGIIESDAQRDFSGVSPTAMSAWEKYAQVLLLSNEFNFVD